MHALRRKALSDLYVLYKKNTDTLNVACERGCSACCTQHVTITTLEGDVIIRHLKKHQAVTSLEMVTKGVDSNRFKPRTTTNQFAAACMRGEEVEEDGSCSEPVSCYFLKNDECMIYEVRPFGCRCFFSTVRCSEQTHAVVAPVLLTINTVFLQCLEHMDMGGRFGNMYDVLDFIYRDSDGRGLLHLPQNQPIPALMIPPEHRRQTEPIVRELRELLKEVTDR